MTPIRPPLRQLALPLLLSMLAACSDGASPDVGQDAALPAASATTRGLSTRAPAPVSDTANGQAASGSQDAVATQAASGEQGISATQNAAATDKPPASGAAGSGRVISASACPLRYTEPTGPAGGHGADPLRGRQWYLNNTGATTSSVQGEDLHMGDVWTQAGQGQGVRVAVVDESVEVTHEDLLANIVPNASYNYDASGRGNAYPLPCNAGSTHGTAVAGVVGARDFNGKGGVGVAPRVRLVGYNPLATSTDADVLDALTRGLGINAIYNNSWGPNDWGHFIQSQPSDDAWQQAIARGLRDGRRGRGAIYVFAAGNGAEADDFASYDAGISALGAIAVCATNAAGQRAVYSEPGSNLLVCAPSGDYPRDGKPALAGVTTTALQNQYRDDFNGTSAAAPMVSGVVALMLQANPRLTWRDVPIILARTARRVDAQSAGWKPYHQLAYHHEYGFGVVDAQAAVRMARHWRSVGDSRNLRQCGPYRVTPDQAIPKAANPDKTPDYNKAAQGGLASAITVPQDCPIRHIEHVGVKMSAMDPKQDKEAAEPGNLQITLTAPTGHTATLAYPHRCLGVGDSGQLQRVACMGLVDQYFGISRFMGQPALTHKEARWTLNAVDRNTEASSPSARVKYWELTLYGH